MHIYVINLARRPDRKAFMEQQAAALGLSLDFVESVDALALPDDLGVRVRKGLHGRLSDGDLACALSHRKVWQRIVESGEQYAVVLEDDAILSADSPLFFSATDWIPAAARLVKLERHGKPKPIVMGRMPRPALSRRIGPLYSKCAGAAGYVVSAEGARLLLAHTETVDDPIDQLMFNPGRSPLFRQLAPHIVEPAICQQEQVEVSSDIARDRHARRVQAALDEARSLPRQVAAHFGMVLALALGRAERRPLCFR